MRQGEYQRERRESSEYRAQESQKQLDRALVKTYGITRDEYNRMLAEQGGVCAICEQSETSQYRGKLRALSVDHCHTTGRVRGLLCNNCNRGIGNLGDNASRLRAAAEYLDTSESSDR